MQNKLKTINNKIQIKVLTIEITQKKESNPSKQFVCSSRKMNQKEILIKNGGHLSIKSKCPFFRNSIERKINFVSSLIFLLTQTVIEIFVKVKLDYFLDWTYMSGEGWT